MGLDVTGQKKSRDKVLCPGLSWDKITTLKPKIVFVFQKLYFLFNFFPSSHVPYRDRIEQAVEIPSHGKMS